MTIVKAVFFSIETQDLILISSRGVLQDLRLQRSAAEVQLWQCCFSDRSGIWVFPKIGVQVPQNGWFIMENPIKMDDLGVQLFLVKPICKT